MKSSTPFIDPIHVRPQDIRRLFTNITPRYDLLNTLLSFKLDACWRKCTIDEGLKSTPRFLLDVGTGTGKLLEGFLARQNFIYACGIDLTESMLAKAKPELPQALLGCANALNLPFRSSSFDLVVSSFTMRSIPDLAAFFGELNRVLVSGGRVVILELTRPPSAWLRLAYYPYLKIYLPLVGRLVSGDPNAYRFLSDSISRFRETPDVLGVMEKAGYRNACAIPLTGGLATLFLGEKV